MSLAALLAGHPLASVQPGFGTPPYAPQDQSMGQPMGRQHGFAGFLDRALNPTNALGQFGQALVAGGGSLADAMGYLMQSRAAKAKADSQFGDWRQQYDYALAHPKASQAQPYRWESNDGSVHELGPGGQQREIYHDPVAKGQYITDPKTGEIRWVPVPGTGNVPAAESSALGATGLTFTPIGGPTPQASGTFPR